MFYAIKAVPKRRVDSIWSLILWSNVLGLGLLSSTGLEAKAFPRVENASSVGIESPTLRNVFVPPNDSLPEGSRTRGAAARRPSCLQPNEQEAIDTVAVLPDSNYGHTVKSRPVFLVYTPNIPADTHNIFFHIRDEQGENVYGTFLPIDANTNMLRVQLPEDAPHLQVGQVYKWSVAIPCSGDLKPDTPFVSGWIERVNDETSLETSALSPLERVYQYGQAGLWYDMMALSDELYRAQPQDTETITLWREVLQWTTLDETLGTLQ